jgi:aminoglycoside phosphotransferase family enzyme/predicted kinase
VRAIEPPPLQLRETHCSWVVLAGSHAYKLKKPVRFAFLDYGTPARRRAAAEEELRVNRPLAGPLMEEVLGLRASPSGAALCPADDPRADDWLLRMRRYDERRTLAALAERGVLHDEHVEAAAERVAAFHAGAPVVADARAAARVARALTGNLAELEGVAGPRAGEVRALAPLLARLVTRFAPVMDDRAARGLVRDGHGDLRADHVLLPAAGGVLVLDRIEFDPALRRIDVADDLSFLAMDLERLAGPRAAARFAAAYREAGGDPGDARLLALFGAHRALVRAKVALLRLRQGAAGGHHGAEAAGLLGLGARLAWRAAGPLVLVVAGPPASGKTTLASALARRSGLGVLSTDRVRDEVLVGAGSGNGSGPADRYDDASRAAVYEALGYRARQALTSGRGVILDATFGDPALRAAFLGALGEMGEGRVRAVVCDAPREVALARASRPRAGGSEAGPDVAAHLRDAFSAPAELAPGDVLAVDATRAVADVAGAVESWLPVA